MGFVRNRESIKRNNRAERKIAVRNEGVDSIVQQSAGRNVRVINETAINVAAREQARLRNHERRTYLGFTPNPYTPEQWQALCDRHDNCCARCGGDGPLTVDHILPVSKGGLNNIENIQPLCLGCNLNKHTDETDYRKAV